MSRPCPGSPAAVMSSMRCTNSGRWSVTWRTGPTRRSTPAPSSSESKPPPSGGRAGRSRSLAQKLRYARQAEAKAIALADDVAVLARWLRDDILSVAGPEYAIRRELFDFVVAELRAREPACPHRIRPVRQLLENQRDHLLAFAVELDRDLAALARQWQIGSDDRPRGPGDAGPADVADPEAVAARGGAARDA